MAAVGVENQEIPSQDDDSDRLNQLNQVDLFTMDGYQETIDSLVMQKNTVSITSEDVSEEGLLRICEKYPHKNVIQVAENADNHIQDGNLDITSTQEALESVIISCLNNNIHATRDKYECSVKNVEQRNEIKDVALLSRMNLKLIEGSRLEHQPPQVNITEIDMNKYT